MRRRTLFRAAAAASLVGAAAGCDAGKNTSSRKNGKTETIRYLTSYGNFGRDGYVYVAKEKGYFADAGFEVDIKTGAGTAAGVKQIVAGTADFTPVDLSGCLLATGGKGDAAAFTAVAAIHQNTLTAIVSLKGNGITAPKDLEGKTLCDLPGSVQRTLFPTFAKLAGFDYSKVHWQDATAQTVIANLAARKVDGIGQFVVAVPTVETAAKGREAVVLPFGDYLSDLYGNVLITSKKYAADNPDGVKRFSEALLKGLNFAIDNPAELATILQKYVPAANPKAAAAEMTLMAPYVRSSAAGVPVGALEATRVARSIAILQGSGQIAPGLRPEQVISEDLLPHA